jgi:hexokinase
VRNVLIAAGAVTAAWYASFYGRRYIQRERRKALLQHYREKMLVSGEKLREIRDEFEHQIRLGLEAHGQSTLMMLPTMIDILPTGSESGVFYSLDFGGTNFRVVTITLSKRANRVGDVDMKSYPFTPEMKKGPVEALFDTMAGKLVDFAQECGHDPQGADAPVVGFCFSFPVDQTSVSSGRIVAWTKGFENTGAVGSDPVKLLQDALHRQGMNAKVKVLINDTVGVMAAGRYMNPDAMIGLILGTGTNACYAENVSRVKTLPADYKPNGPLMCINTEWGNFSSPVLPRLDEDLALDADSVNPGEMIFEKLISGMYLGELACRIMLKLAREGSLFGGRVPEALIGPPWAFNAGDVAFIHSDETHDLSFTAARLSQKFGLDIDTIPYGCRRNVKYVCKLVGQRAANLVGTAIAALVRHTGRDMPSTHLGSNGAISETAGDIPHTVVSADGSLILKYDKFRLAVKVALAQICGKEVAEKVEIKKTEDGSSIGAACLAACAAQTADD